MMEADNTSDEVQRLKVAMSRLSDNTHSTFDNIIDSSAQSLSKAVKTLSNSISDGIRDIKSELDFTDVVARNPWGTVAGCVALGATFEYTTKRLCSIQLKK